MRCGELCLWCAIGLGPLAPGAVDHHTPGQNVADLERTGQAEVSGLIIDQNGNPVAGAYVELVDRSPFKRGTVTDGAGHFAIESVPSGEYSLRATKPGYLPGAYGSHTPASGGALIRLEAGKALANLHVTLIRGAAIAGVVRSDDGRPVEGAIVSALPLGRDGVLGSPTASAGSDDRGSYRLFGLVGGDYLVEASSDAVTVPASPSKSENDVIIAALQRGGAVPPAGAESQTFDRMNVGQATLPARTFFPDAPTTSSAAVVELAAGDERTRTDITLASAPIRDIAGTVLGGLAPGSKVVTLLERTSSVPSSPLVAVDQVTASADGRFSFHGVPAGGYVLEARTAASRGSTGPPPPDEFARAEVEVNGDLSVDLTLAPTANVLGRVVLDPMPGPVPADLSRLRVRLVGADDVARGTLSSMGLAAAPAGRSASLNPDGSFAIVGVEPGEYRVEMDGAPVGWSLRSALFNGRDILNSAAAIDHPDPAATPLLLVATNRQTEITGTVRADGSVVLSSYSVVAFAMDPALWSSRPVRTLAAPLDDNGTFRIGGLPPGEYYLAVTSTSDAGDLSDPLLLQALVPASIRITLVDHLRQDLRILR